MTGPLLPERVEPLLRGRLGRPYLHAHECPSTQDLLRGSAHPDGAVAVAEHQTAGRGRSGRAWDDAPGASLLVSVLLRPPDGAPPLPQLALVAGLAVAEAVEARLGAAAALKWPNDVLVEGRKIAGILLEAADGEVVCGIGVNVNQTAAQLPAAARLEPTSLRVTSGREHDRAMLLADLLARLELRYDAWLGAGLRPLEAELARRDALRGRPLRVGDVRGEGAGIAADGRLAVATRDAGRVLVESGEVELAE